MKLLKKAGFRNITLISLFLIFSFLSPSFASAAEKIELTGIRYWSYPDYTRVVLELSENPEFIKNRLFNPDRLYFDIKNTRVTKELKKDISIGNGMLKSVRARQFNNSTVRVVLDLEKIKNYKVFTLEDPIRIIIDIYGPIIFSAKRRIVLDPGHGGKDPGAVGRNGLYEKDVVLDIALKLKKILSKNPDFEIFLTRDKDVFVPLVERNAVANSKNADLFISIHTNASPRKNTKGIETYLLNWTNKVEWMKVAARENQISLKQMKKMQKKRNVLEIMLSDLSRENKRNESMALAKYVQESIINGLDRNYRHIVDLGVKQAFFFVLYGAKMPSILVEVSFISNPVEARRLKKNKYRNDLAKSIASGINKYMSSMPDGHTIADSRSFIAPGD